MQAKTYIRQNLHDPPSLGVQIPGQHPPHPFTIPDQSVSHHQPPFASSKMPKSFHSIPFPQTGERSPRLGSSLLGTRGDDRIHQAEAAWKGTHAPYSVESIGSSHLTSQMPPREKIPSNASSTSSSSTHGENLPSIRNLLISIGQEEGSHSSTFMRKSPSAPDLQGNGPYLSTSNNEQAPVSYPTGVRMQSTPGVASHRWNGASYGDRQRPYTTSMSWDYSGSLRSMSPQRRPPIAPSAFAHNHYNQVAQGFEGSIPSSSKSSYQVTAAGARSHRSGYPPLPMSTDTYKKQKSLHSPSSSIPSITSEEWAEGSLPIGGLARGAEEGSSSHLTKRDTQSRVEAIEGTGSPAATRRRHTVGALEEPVHLHSHAPPSAALAAERQRRIVENTSTPRSQAHLSPKGRAGPESPTTPTADSIAPHLTKQRRGSGPQQQPQVQAHSALNHRIYLQQAEAGTGSLPSLSSSASTASLSSERMRVQSLEDQRRWHGAAQGYPISKNSVDPFMSPPSSVWHSRSSTLDSIETSGSLASAASQYSKPFPPPRSSSLTNEEMKSFPWPLTPVRRPRDPDRVHHGVMHERTRHESLRGGRDLYDSSEFRDYPGSHPTLDMPMSAPDATDASSRQRAQTMTFSERLIAPLPSHGSSHHHLSTTPRALPPRSSSSHSVGSVGSLPQRVSSMEIDVGAAHSGRRMYEQSARSPGIAPLSSVSMTSSLSGPSLSHHGSGSSALSTVHGAKYECGWCGKRFSRPSSLKIHHHSHTGEKPFVCPAPNCGRTFSVQSNLRRHQKCHATSGTGRGTAKKETGSRLVSSAPFEAGHHGQHPMQGIPSSQSVSSASLSRSRGQIAPSSTVHESGPWTTKEARTGAFPHSREVKESQVSSDAEEEEEEEYEEGGEGEDLDEEDEEDLQTSPLRNRRPMPLAAVDDMMEDVDE